MENNSNISLEEIFLEKKIKKIVKMNFHKIDSDENSYLWYDAKQSTHNGISQVLHV